MVSMKKLMALSQYEMGVLDGIAKVKDMLIESNSCNGKISRLMDEYHGRTQAEMVGETTDKVGTITGLEPDEEETEPTDSGDDDD